MHSGTRRASSIATCGARFSRMVFYASHQRLACRPGAGGRPRKTRPRMPGAPACSWSKSDMPRFKTGQRLKKVGLKARDTAEPFCRDVMLPPGPLLGGAAQENRGFIGLMEKQLWERLQIATTAAASAQAAIDWTCGCVKNRKSVRAAGGELSKHALQAGQTAKRGVPVRRPRGLHQGLRSSVIRSFSIFTWKRVRKLLPSRIWSIGSGTTVASTL